MTTIDDSPAENAPGLVCTVAQDGTLLEVIRDDPGILASIAPGEPLIRILDPRSVGKLLNLLAELKGCGVALDWEINVLIRGRLEVMIFGGAYLRELDRFFMVAARSRKHAVRLYELLPRLEGHSIPEISRVLKAREDHIQSTSREDAMLFDEITRLNNELVTLQRELAKSNVELQRLNELKNRFIGMAAHDVRSPLAHILTYCDLLMSSAWDRLSNEEIEFLSVIQSSSQLLVALVDDFLDVSIIESGRLQLNPEPTDLGSLVTRNVAHNARLAAKKDIRIVWIEPGSFPEVTVDPIRMEQILNNLLSNAVKFSNPGSTIEVALTQGENLASLAVRDQGTGMTRDQLNKLFAPFEGPRSRGTWGERTSGLGLAIAYKIVSEHRGRIEVNSEPGQGTIVLVSLPLAPPEGSF